MSEQTRKRGVRLFENPLLDWGSRAHPAVPAVLWLPIMAASLWWGHQQGVSLWASALLWVGGFVAWTLFEYILHRWIFHFIPEDPERRAGYYIVHQIHHDYHEWDRLVAPPMMSIPLGAIFLLAFWGVFALTPLQAMMWPFYAGFIVGYLAYDYVHFYTHFGKPRSKYFKILRRRHMQHHTTYPDKWFGVSNSFWDFVFRTAVKPGDRPVKQPEIEWNRQIFED